MVYLFDGFNDFIRLSTGERLHAALAEFVRATKIQGAWVSGLGAASQVELGFYDLRAKTYQWRTFDGAYEITSLQGSIALDEQGKPVFHLHGTFADNAYQTIGGHVRDLVVGGTCELFAHRSYQPLRRARDEASGLNLLQL